MKNTTLLVVILVVLGVVALILLGYRLAGQGPASSPPAQEEMVFEQPPPQLPDSLYNLIGTVKIVNPGSAVIDAQIPHLGEQGNVLFHTEERTILFLDETKITKLSLLTTGQNAGRAEEQNATISDIPVGGMVEVIADEDIKKLKEFDVIRVRILPN